MENVRRLSRIDIITILKNNSSLLIFAALFIFAAVQYDKFLSQTFITNLLLQNTMIAFLAFGMTFVILTGGIDLSVGSMLALCGIVAARLSHMNIFIVVGVTLIVGIAIGLVNGFLVVRLKIVPFISTLAMMIGIRGYIFLTTGSKSVPIPHKTAAFTAIAKGQLISGIPNAVLLMTVALLVGIIVLKYTRFGRHIYAVGGNEDAARMMGIAVDKIKLLTYAVNGFLAAMAGLIMTSRLGSGQFNGGTGWELDAIAATVIGGTLISGGRGKLGGTFFGVLILGIMKQIFNLQGNLNTWWQNIATGVILLIVVIIQSRADNKN